MKQKLVISLIITFLLSNLAQAKTLNNIIIKGNVRTDAKTIESHLDLKEGDNISSEAINNSIKKLYKTGLFSSVKISNLDNKIIINLVENPKINKIAFEGNKAFKDSELIKELNLKPLSPYNKSKIQSDTNRIINMYNDNGRYAVTVIPKIIKLEDSRINIVFEINEGPKASIKKIIFVGNEHYTDSALKEVIATEKYRFYKFFSKSHFYNPYRVNVLDRELLRKFYLNNGFPDFKLLSVNAEISSNKKQFYITYSIDEGAKYQFNEININNEITKINLKDLENKIKTKKGDTYNYSEIESTINQMTDYLNDKNIPFVDIDAEQKINKETKKIDVTYIVKPGSKFYIGRININGNEKTDDKVIRREFRISEGDPYNASKVNRSEQRINNLGYFGKVEFNLKDGDRPDQKDIDVNIIEKSTTSLQFAVGYETSHGPVGKINFTEQNLFGKGQELNIGFSKFAKKFDSEIGFTENYFLDIPLSLGVDLFRVNNQRDPARFVKFDDKKFGAGLRIGYNLTEHLNHKITLLYKNSDMSNFDPDVSKYLIEQEGKKITQSISHRFLYDKRDLAYNTTRGYMAYILQEYAGIGGDIKYLKHRIGGSFYTPVYKDLVILKLTGEYGSIKGLSDQKVLLNDRFYLGGDSFRGFEDFGIGPREKVSKEFHGGKNLIKASAEIKFPLGMPKDLEFYGVGFAEAGKINGVDKEELSSIESKTLLDSNKIRISAGLGIGFTTPMGPISIYYAVPIKKEPFDQVRNFGVSFTSSF